MRATDWAGGPARCMRRQLAALPPGWPHTLATRDPSPGAVRIRSFSLSVFLCQLSRYYVDVRRGHKTLSILFLTLKMTQV